MPPRSCSQCIYPPSTDPGEPGHLWCFCPCEQVLYCSRDCSDKHWEIHKFSCKLVRDAVRTSTVSFIPMMLSSPGVARPLFQLCLDIANIPAAQTNSPTHACESFTVCTLPRGMKDRILAEDDFPRKMYMPPSLAMSRVVPINGKGLGLLANRVFDQGVIIVGERVLLIVSYPAAGTNCMQSEDGASIEWGWEHGEDRIHEGVRTVDEGLLGELVRRLSHEKATAYSALANSHTHDGTGPLSGTLRTNFLTVPRLALKEFAPKGVEFAAVCEILSRVNHSCVPNAAVRFDVSSFAYTLYATRTIKAGEEITISYTQLIAPAATRQARLARYGFACICPSCTFHDASDQVRGWLANSLPPPSRVLRALLRSKSHYGLPDNKLVEIAHQINQILTAENLQASPMYAELLGVLGLLYAAVGWPDCYTKMQRLAKGARLSFHPRYHGYFPQDPTKSPFWNLYKGIEPRIEATEKMYNALGGSLDTFCAIRMNDFRGEPRTGKTPKVGPFFNL